jgi:MOSC domain-containing protein YiiM
VLLDGVDVDSTPGRTLGLDCGSGTVLLRLHGRANPCAWLDHTVGAGAWKGLRGHGGMRCEPLSDGVLRVGPVAVTWLD